MSEVKLSAVAREDFGKGAARRLRRDGQVPAVVYGAGIEPMHIALPHHETLLALRNAGVVLTIEIEGGKTIVATPKQVQRDPIKGFVEHVDLMIAK